VTALLWKSHFALDFAKVELLEVEAEPARFAEKQMGQ